MKFLINITLKLHIVIFNDNIEGYIITLAFAICVSDKYIFGLLMRTIVLRMTHYYFFLMHYETYKAFYCNYKMLNRSIYYDL